MNGPSDIRECIPPVIVEMPDGLRIRKRKKQQDMEDPIFYAHDPTGKNTKLWCLRLVKSSILAVNTKRWREEIFSNASDILRQNLLMLDIYKPAKNGIVKSTLQNTYKTTPARWMNEQTNKKENYKTQCKL